MGKYFVILSMVIGLSASWSTAAFARLSKEAADNNLVEGQGLTATTLNPCLFQKVFDEPESDTIIAIQVAEGTFATPNNTDYLTSFEVDTVPLTKELLENTCGVFDVTINEVTANGTTFDTATRYGFDFNYSLTSGGPSQNAKYFLIGDEPQGPSKEELAKAEAEKKAKAEAEAKAKAEAEAKAETKEKSEAEAEAEAEAKAKAEAEAEKKAKAEAEARSNANAMIARANTLADNQVDLVPFLQNNLSGHLTGGGNSDIGTIDFASGARLPIWMRIKTAWSKIGDNRNQTLFGTAGAHYTINENLLLGAMAQIDRSRTVQDNRKLESTGWLIGPYIVAKLPTQPLYAEARALWGKTSNKNALVEQKNQFDTNRMLLKGKIAGDVFFETFTLTPNIEATYIRDKQEAYKSTAGFYLNEQSITYAQVKLGLDVVIPIAIETGRLNFKTGLFAVYDKTTSSLIDSQAINEINNIAARVDFGFNYAISSNMSAKFNGHFTGLGNGNRESYGLLAGINIKF